MAAQTPQIGQLVRVTTLRAIWGGTHPRGGLVIPAGTLFEGMVVEVADGWLTINTGTHTLRFAVNDDSLRITIIAFAVSA